MLASLVSSVISYLHVIDGPPTVLPGDGVVQPHGDPGVDAGVHLQDAAAHGASSVGQSQEGHKG